MGKVQPVDVPSPEMWSGWSGLTIIELDTMTTWGFLKWGYPNSWMVYFMENPTKMDDVGEYTFW